MRKLLLVSTIFAAVISICAFAPMDAQDGGSAASLPQLPFHLVENFFHYPAHSVVGRMSGIAVAPTGNILALNRGYHPVLEFKSTALSCASGRRVRNVRWRPCSALRSAGHPGTWMPPRTSFTALTPKAALWARWEQTRSPDLADARDSERRRAGPPFIRKRILRTKDGSMFVSDGYGNSRVAKFDKDGNFVKSWGERGNQPGDFNTPHSLVVRLRCLQWHGVGALPSFRQ